MFSTNFINTYNLFQFEYFFNFIVSTFLLLNLSFNKIEVYALFKIFYFLNSLNISYKNFMNRESIILKISKISIGNCCFHFRVVDNSHMHIFAFYFLFLVENKRIKKFKNKKKF